MLRSGDLDEKLRGRTDRQLEARSCRHLPETVHWGRDFVIQYKIKINSKFRDFLSSSQLAISIAQSTKTGLQLGVGEVATPRMLQNCVTVPS